VSAQVRQEKEKMNTTMEDLRRLVGVLEELVRPLLEGEEVEDTYESNKRPHLVLQEGSKTYGRLFVSTFQAVANMAQGIGSLAGLAITLEELRQRRSAPCVA
jgi:hypothetical protein